MRRCRALIPPWPDSEAPARLLSTHDMNLKPELAARLSRVAAYTGHSEDYFAEQAIQEFLDNREAPARPEDLESLRRRL